MAKLQTPLLSFNATGRLSDSLVYSTWKTVSTVRKKTKATNPKSLAQIQQRFNYAAATLLYHDPNLQLVDFKAWNRYASNLPKRMSGWNAFYKDYLIIRETGLEDVNLLHHGALYLTDPTHFYSQCQFYYDPGSVTMLWGYSSKSLYNLASLTLIAPNLWQSSSISATFKKHVYCRFTAMSLSQLLCHSGTYKSLKSY